MTRIAGRITGKVQGVGFRWFVVTEAERLDIRGWVRNTREGHVEFEAEGDDDAIAEFTRRISQGPPAARVSSVVDLPVTDDALDGFVVLH